MKQINMNNVNWKIEAINDDAYMQVIEHREDFGKCVTDNLYVTNKNERVRLAHVKLWKNDNIIRPTNALFLEHLNLKEVLQLLRHWKVNSRLDQLLLVNVGN